MDCLTALDYNKESCSVTISASRIKACNQCEGMDVGRRKSRRYGGEVAKREQGGKPQADRCTACGLY